MPAAPTTANSTTTKPVAHKKPPREPVREAIETVVFVVVLVLLLKLFAVEAFVIPTGSMAESLYGYHKWVDCPECGYRFPVNCSDEVEPQGGSQQTNVTECKCPNCRYFIQDEIRTKRIPTTYDSGDRVLVLKALYHLEEPKRGHVVVFKYPERPQAQHAAQNYIKRLWGFGGETMAIHRGKVFVTNQIQYPAAMYPEAERPEDAWQRTYTHRNANEAVSAFNAARFAGFPEGKDNFELIRKSDELVLEMCRIVYHNDYQSKTLAEKGYPARWADRDNSGSWKLDSPTLPKEFTHTGEQLTWVRYKHLIQNSWSNPPKALEDRITNFLGYNTSNMSPGKRRDPGDYWTGDLMLEFHAKVGDKGELVAELSRGAYRYQAKFANGQVSLVKITGKAEETLATQPCALNGPGDYDVRFANVDCRLRVWVKKTGLFSRWKRVEFGPAADYPFSPVGDSDPMDTHREGLTQANDLAAPASIGAIGDITVKNIAIYRDTVYTTLSGDRPDNAGDYVETFYVPKGHYMVLGDNSAQSSDGRDWGAVPERLMMGRAVFIFFPFPPLSPVNRFGVIR